MNLLLTFVKSSQSPYNEVASTFLNFLSIRVPKSIVVSLLLHRELSPGVLCMKRYRDAKRKGSTS